MLVKIKFQLIDKNGNEKQGVTLEEEVNLGQPRNSMLKQDKGLGLDQMKNHLSDLHHMEPWDDYSHGVSLRLGADQCVYVQD
jgi:hypothetical protein